ncbi:FAD-dependent oxidoreductase [Streptomyces caniscabiei]|uniref:protoporphyrinogen/coproporphyrinogen oxidase n=1 Tax=Streptomyces caniscabiei TaxID=2746961 RepID=UPI0029B08468|nr:FAD-dependent oxidoreductase [Streptomyces caniscabiei]MDX2600354.1 FAD-dependent oxidoreductase [Streptomyces caniscabiei]
MHVIVVGGGIAGLGAAYELRSAGVEVTLLEAGEVLGGRCRSVDWHDEWLITGAMAFHEADQNIVDLAKDLGIRGTGSEGLVDLSDAHSERIVRGEGVVEVDDFTVSGLLAAKGIPLTEKANLARLLPLSQRLHSDSERKAQAAVAELDEIDACDHMRKLAPVFTDYVIEPTMQMFCGYEAGDYSLAWLLASLGPVRVRGDKTAKLNWWTFAERGVGALTHHLGERLSADAGCRIRTGATVSRVEVLSEHARVEVDGEQIEADAVIVAVPAPQARELLTGIALPAAQTEFLDWIAYRGHHITYFLLDDLADDETNGAASTAVREGVGLLLPTAEGYETISNLSVRRIDDGVLVYGEMKGGACERLLGKSDDDVLDTAWAELCRVIPGAGQATVRDRLLSRNDLGLCTYPVGYQKRKAAFQAEPLPDRLALAGDWLESCTVGSAHMTGVAAAQQILDARSAAAH